MDEIDNQDHNAQNIDQQDHNVKKANPQDQNVNKLDHQNQNVITGAKASTSIWRFSERPCRGGHSIGFAYQTACVCPRPTW